MRGLTGSELLRSYIFLWLKCQVQGFRFSAYKVYSVLASGVHTACEIQVSDSRQARGVEIASVGTIKHFMGRVATLY